MKNDELENSMVLLSNNKEVFDDELEASFDPLEIAYALLDQFYETDSDTKEHEHVRDILLCLMLQDNQELLMNIAEDEELI